MTNPEESSHTRRFSDHALEKEVAQHGSQIEMLKDGQSRLEKAMTEGFGQIHMDLKDLQNALGPKPLNLGWAISAVSLLIMIATLALTPIYMQSNLTRDAFLDHEKTDGHPAMTERVKRNREIERLSSKHLAELNRRAQEEINLIRSNRFTWSDGIKIENRLRVIEELMLLKKER